MTSADNHSSGAANTAGYAETATKMSFWYCDHCETIWRRDSADTCWICDGEPSPVADDFVYTSPSQGRPLAACHDHYPNSCTCE